MAGMRTRLFRIWALGVWLYGFWLLLTWTVTAEQLVFGALVCIWLAVLMSALGPICRPWRVLAPRRLVAILVLIVDSLVRIVRANLSLARRIWSPSRPLRSGMLIVPTTMCIDGDVAAVGLITSLIVDNQIVDLDRSRRELQYHAVDVPTPKQRYGRVNGPTERRVVEIRKGR
jgi:multicomponent Na+:H+ antiporter subunit E